jgi:uncharacterized membrane protein YbhN (UPF0104 family)
MASEDVTVVISILTFIVWTIACSLPAYVAGQKHRQRAAWFFISLVFSPLLGLLALCALPNGTYQRAEKGW